MYRLIQGYNLIAVFLNKFKITLNLEEIQINSLFYDSNNIRGNTRQAR